MPWRWFYSINNFMPLVLINYLLYMDIVIVSNEVLSWNPIFDHFIDYLANYIKNKAAKRGLPSCLPLQVVQRVWFIGVKQWLYATWNNPLVCDHMTGYKCSYVHYQNSAHTECLPYAINGRSFASFSNVVLT